MRSVERLLTIAVKFSVGPTCHLDENTGTKTRQGRQSKAQALGAPERLATEQPCEDRLMLRNSKYSVWFRTPKGEGHGVISLMDGNLSGGDNISSYTGTYVQDGDA